MRTSRRRRRAWTRCAGRRGTRGRELRLGSGGTVGGVAAGGEESGGSALGGTEGGSEELTPEAQEAATPQRSGLFGPLQLDSSRDRALTEGFGVCNCSGE